MPRPPKLPQQLSDKCSVDEAVSVRLQVERLHRWTLNPKGRFLKYWDKTMLIALAYTVVVTPFEVGFLGINSTYFSLLFVSNRVVGQTNASIKWPARPRFCTARACAAHTHTHTHVC